MKSFLRKRSIRLKCLVITLLLSFVGQAAALSDACTMAQTDLSHADMSSVQTNDDMPCHSMSRVQDVEKNASADPNQGSMDCCDPAMMADSSCSCPDNGCSGSAPFISQSITDSSSYTEHRNYYAQPRLPTSISSALFRPPIA